jgi:hypothetical protein
LIELNRIFMKAHFRQGFSNVKVHVNPLGTSLKFRLEVLPGLEIGHFY